MITLNEAKQHLRVTHDAEDAYIQSLIEMSIERLEQATGKALRVRDEIITLDAFPDIIELPFSPVISVVDIAYLDQSGTSQAVGSYILDLRSLYPTLQPAEGQSWPKNKPVKQAVSITVRVGHPRLPATLKHAAFLLIGHLYENRELVVIGADVNALPVSMEYLIQPHRILKV